MYSLDYQGALWGGQRVSVQGINVRRSVRASFSAGFCVPLRRLHCRLQRIGVGAVLGALLWQEKMTSFSLSASLALVVFFSGGDVGRLPAQELARVAQYACTTAPKSQRSITHTIHGDVLDTLGADTNHQLLGDSITVHCSVCVQQPPQNYRRN